MGAEVGGRAGPPGHAARTTSGGDAATLGQLQAVEERTRLILETANDAFVGIDEHGTIIDWNRAAELTFGWSADEAVGRPLVETIVPVSYRDAHRRGLRRFVETGEQRVLFQRSELSALHRQGHEFPVELTIWPTRNADDTWRFNAFLRDLSERHQLQSHARVLHRITATSNAAVTAEEAARAAAREVLELADWALGHTFLVAEDGRLTPTGWWERREGEYRAFEELTDVSWFEVGRGLPGRAAAHAAPDWIVDVSNDPNFPRAATAAACGIVTAAAFPVMSAQRVVAVLEFFATAPRPPDEALLQLMGDVGVHLGRVFEREEANRLLREADRAKSRLMSTVAHELRTPLAAMTGWAALLEEAWNELADEERLNYLGSVNRQTRRLRRLVEDLLTFTQIEERGMDHRPQPVALRELVDEVLAALDVGPVDVEIPDRLVVRADADHLVRIAENLLSNAVKYGSPPIRVAATTDGSTAEIRVSDAGPGVPDAFVPELFEPFTRAHGSDLPGTGLGLSIIRGLAELHGGSLTYEPNEPEGTCFVVRLPAGGDGEGELTSPRRSGQPGQ